MTLRTKLLRPIIPCSGTPIMQSSLTKIVVQRSPFNKKSMLFVYSGLLPSRSEKKKSVDSYSFWKSWSHLVLSSSFLIWEMPSVAIYSYRVKKVEENKNSVLLVSTILFTESWTESCPLRKRINTRMTIESTKRSKENKLTKIIILDLLSPLAS